MTTPDHRWLTAGLVLGMTLGGQALAQTSNGNQGLELIKGGATPLAIRNDQVLNNRSCPLVVTPTEAALGLQPLWLDPSQVAAKNRMGCLSGADAIYGPDGCPSRRCSASQGIIPLPVGTVLPAAPQLPEP